jgi:UTP--glucose-1-phosphate uridylyltransferase
MKALIPAAGHGTRFLPVTRVVPKEMLPIGAKPAIQLIVEEALAAGADEVVVVTSPEKGILRRYFEGDPDLASRVRWAMQEEQLGLGHAVLQAAPLLEGEREPVLVLLGDALVAGESPSAVMAEISRRHGGASVVGLEEVPLERVSRYGIVKGEACEGEDGRVYALSDLVEKPAPEEAPSRLAVAGRYLLDPAVFGLLATQTPGAGGEVQLTDAIRRLLAERPVFGYRYPGRRQDIGNPAGYLKALNEFAHV